MNKIREQDDNQGVVLSTTTGKVSRTANGAKGS